MSVISLFFISCPQLMLKTLVNVYCSLENTNAFFTRQPSSPFPEKRKQNSFPMVFLFLKQETLCLLIHMVNAVYNSYSLDVNYLKAKYGLNECGQMCVPKPLRIDFIIMNFKVKQNKIRKLDLTSLALKQNKIKMMLTCLV